MSGIMSSFAILLFIICLPVILCQDLCQLIAPNGHYKGLGIYQLWDMSGGKWVYWMYNKQGLEWKVVINASDAKNLIFVNDYDSKREMNINIEQRFGVKAFLSTSSVVCDIIENEWICRNNLLNKVIEIQKSPETNLTDKVFMIFNILFPLYETNIEIYVLKNFFMINKQNKKERYKLIVSEEEGTIAILPLEDGTTENLKIWNYLELLNDLLFQSIESIVDYFIFEIEDDKYFTYIMVFDINHRPYYCFLWFDYSAQTYRNVRTFT